MEQTELLTLIERCRTGDRTAQERLVVETQDRVYYHCKKFLKNEEDAQDATQDVLIAMITGLDKLRQPAAFWGWLNGITANRCKHLLTQGTREWQIPEDEEGNSMLDSVETLDDQTVPDKVMDNAETQRLVMDIIDGLPAEQRMTVTFFYYDEMSVKDIARAMDVSEGTVKSRLNYARKTIKVEVEKLEKKDGTKLYSVSILPFLAYFLRMGAQSQALSPSAAAAITQRTLAATATAPTAGAGASSAAGGGGAAAPTGAAAATAVGTKTAAGAAAAGGVAAKTGLGIGIKLIAGVLIGALTLGGVGAGMYLSTHWDELAARLSGIVGRTGEDPVAYRQAYAQKVRELENVDGEYLYDLIYIDEDDTPELVVHHPSTDVIRIYTIDPDEQLCEVMEYEDSYPHGSYYPKANIIKVLADVEKVQVGPEMADFVFTMAYYHIDATGKAEIFYTSKSTPSDGRDPAVAAAPPPEAKGHSREDISPDLTAPEVLELLGQGQAPVQNDPAPETTPEPTPAPAYAAAYAAKVRELGAEASCGLAFINEDDTPELIVSTPRYFGGYPNGNTLCIYTVTSEGELRLVSEQEEGIRDSMSYYPRKNILYSDSLSGGTGEVYASCYRINEAYELERSFSGKGQWDPNSGNTTWAGGNAPPIPEGETSLPLRTTLTAQELLEQLG